MLRKMTFGLIAAASLTIAAAAPASAGGFYHGHHWGHGLGYGWGPAIGVGFGGVYVDHRFTERFNGQFGYSHFHQDYADIPSASNSPDSNRVYVSIMYGFNRPLGR